MLALVRDSITGRDKAMKTWTLRKVLAARGPQQWVVTDETGKVVVARNNQRDAVLSALRIASETKCGAIEVVGE